MAILVNMGKRGFVLKEGFLNPGDQITVDSETAEQLTKSYPNEIKAIVLDEPKVAVEEETPVAEEPKEEVKEVKPAKRGGRRKKATQDK